MRKITINFDERNNNNKYYLLKNKNRYLLGFYTKYYEDIKRRLNLKDNIRNYLCKNCSYRSYSNIRIAQLYLTLTLEIINSFNRGLISIFKEDKIYTEIIYNKDTPKRILTLDNENKYLIYNFNSEDTIEKNRTYLWKYTSEIENYSRIKCIDITDIKIKKDYRIINFINFLYLMQNFINTLSKELIRLNISKKDILFNSFNYKKLNKNDQLYNSLNELFFSLSQVNVSKNKIDLYNIFIRIERFDHINYLNSIFYFNTEHKNNNNNFLKLLNNLLKEINNCISNKIYLNLYNLKQEQDFCALTFESFFSSGFYSKCKLGNDLIKDPSLIKNISDNIDINNIINKSIYIKNNEIYYRKNIFPIKLEKEIGLFLNLNSSFYNQSWNLLIKQDNIFTPELLGNINSEGIICPGELNFNLKDFFNDSKNILNNFFNSIFTIEPGEKFLIEFNDSNLYINSYLKISNEKINFDEYIIDTIINPENKFISSITIFFDNSNNTHYNPTISSIRFSFLDSSQEYIVIDK